MAIAAGNLVFPAACGAASADDGHDIALLFLLDSVS